MHLCAVENPRMPYGKVAQLVRACGSYPQCRGFKSLPCYQKIQAVRVCPGPLFCYGLGLLSASAHNGRLPRGCFDLASAPDIRCRAVVRARGSVGLTHGPGSRWKQGGAIRSGKTHGHHGGSRRDPGNIRATPAKKRHFLTPSGQGGKGKRTLVTQMSPKRHSSTDL